MECTLYDSGDVCMNKTKEKVLKGLRAKLSLVIDSMEQEWQMGDAIDEALDTIRNETLREVEEVYKGEDYERYEADITYNAYDRKTGKYDVTEIVKGIKRWMRFKINKLNTK